MDHHIFSVTLPREDNEPLMHCKALRRSVINDQAWTVQVVTWDCAPGSPVLSVAILYLPHLCVSPCRTPSYVAFQHFTGVAHATM